MNWKQPPLEKHAALLALCIQFALDLDAFQAALKPLVIDGHSLTIPAITALARFGNNTPVALSVDPDVTDRVDAARAVLHAKVDSNVSVYGVNTGPGGSADTRTRNLDALGLSLIQLQLAGILPTSPPPKKPTSITLLHSNLMPEPWVRAAILVRANAFVRGHSGVRVELIEHLLHLLRADIIPLVPTRGSISASGDLQPLSYVAATLVGSPAVRVYSGPHRVVVPAPRALAAHSVPPLTLCAKEHLGLLNGTSFSAALAALALHDTVHLTVLAEFLTALGTEALLGSRASHYRFLHDTCRPHPGQIEVASTVLWLLNGSNLATGDSDDSSPAGEDSAASGPSALKQDRYALRTSPQFLGPQIEDILSAVKSVEIECNSSTDNPLVDSSTERIHQGGNFQAMSVTSAMEKTRLALYHIGKLMFAQSTEICNPATNCGLPPSVAATDPSLNYHAKGLDIATAAYVAELGWLAGPVGVHAESAEMHNQSVNSLALISARATIQALDVLTMLLATYLYILCQALDLRALQVEFAASLSAILRAELATHFPDDAGAVYASVHAVVHETFARTSTLDASHRMDVVADACTAPLVAHFTSRPALDTLPRITAFQAAFSTRATALLHDLRTAYLTGAKGNAPAAPYLGRTRALYTYVRETLGVPMHGRRNLEGGLDVLQETVGGDVSVVYEAIRDGDIARCVAGVFKGSELL